MLGYMQQQEKIQEMMKKTILSTPVNHSSKKKKHTNLANEIYFLNILGLYGLQFEMTVG